MKINRYSITNTFQLYQSMIKYNLKVIFGGRFLYFLLAAAFVFILFTVLNLLNTRNATLSPFFLILLPGLLLVFYPTTFGIQNDVNNNMIEILFGIPNYRYKVWLFRLLLINVVIFIMLWLLSMMFSLVLQKTAVTSLTLHIMAPVTFVGALAFCVSTLTRNGNGTAVVLIIVCMGFWLMQGQIGETEVNLFLNPFQVPEGMNTAVWADIIFKSRLYLGIGTIISILWGLYNLQKREKFLF
jgi:hypothetical protein